jgi:hypothetical protein
VTPEPDLLTSGPERVPREPPGSGHRRSRRLLVPGLPLAALAAVAAVQLTSPGGTGAEPAPQRAVVVDDPAPTPVPSPTPLPTVRARSTSTDLATTVTVAHVRIPGETYERQTDVLQRIGAGVEGSSSWVRERVRDPAGRTVDGVRLQFERQLSMHGVAQLTTALAAVPGSVLALDAVPGTTVDVSVPTRPRARCLRPDGEGGVVLAQPDMEAVGRAFTAFGLGTAGGLPTVSYSGPRRSRAQLQAVGRALAHSCGAPLSAVTYTRHVLQD